MASLDLTEQFTFILLLEGQLPCEERKEYDTDGPDVCGGSPVGLFGDDLGRHVAGRATEGLELLLASHAEAEVDYLDHPAATVVHDVLRLYVAVRYLLAVRERQTREHLSIISWEILSGITVCLMTSSFRIFKRRSYASVRCFLGLEPLL